MKCSVCKKEIDLNKSGTIIFTLTEKETVYGEFSIYQQNVEEHTVCGVACLTGLVGQLD
jgi:hypothetical protein